MNFFGPKEDFPDPEKWTNISSSIQLSYNAYLVYARDNNQFNLTDCVRGN